MLHPQFLENSHVNMFCIILFFKTVEEVLMNEKATEREVFFGWHLAYIVITYIRKCHKKRSSLSVASLQKSAL